MTEMGDMKFTTAGNMISGFKIMVEPVNGKKYNFPKEIPDNRIGDSEIKNWLIEEGYPEEEILSESFSYKLWYIM